MHINSVDYQYHSAVANHARTVIGSSSIPENYDANFLMHIACEFCPMTQDLLFCWVYDKDKHLLWLSVGGTWTSFKAESSKVIGREIADRLDDVSEYLDGELGYGLITDNVIEAKRLMQKHKASKMLGVS